MALEGVGTHPAESGPLEREAGYDRETRGGGRRGEDRIVTVPNGFTAIRLACVPVFVWLLSRPHGSAWVAAAVLLAVLGVTDWVDGYLARRLHQVSTLGKVFDPTVDRILLSVAAIGILAVGAVPTWVAVVALGREAVVAIGAVGVAMAGGRRIDVRWVGKAATFALMVALPLFLVGHARVGWHQVPEDLAWVFAVPALLLGWAAVVIYVPVARAAVAQGRAGRNTGPPEQEGQ